MTRATRARYLRAMRAAMLVVTAIFGPMSLAPSVHAQPRSVTGSVSMIGRIALGPNAIVVVEARNPGFSGVIGETRIRLAGRQLPADFMLRLHDGRAATSMVILQAAILQSGGARYVSDPRSIELAGAITDAGDLPVGPSRPVAFTSAFQCAGRKMTFGVDGQTSILVLDGQRREMTGQPVASGTLYISQSQPRLSLRQHQGRTTLQIGTGPILRCRPTRQHGGSMTSPDTPQPNPAKASPAGGWIAQSLAGAKPLPGRPMTLSFSQDGRLTGSSSCNRYMASYTVSGDAMTISQAAGTMMACPPPVMEQERRFLGFLAGVVRWRVDAKARLILTNAAGEELVAGAGP